MLPFSVADTFPGSIIVVVSSAMILSVSIFLSESVSLPSPVLVSVLSTVFLSVWSVSASSKLYRVTAVQNLLVQFSDRIDMHAAQPRLRVLSTIPVSISVTVVWEEAVVLSATAPVSHPRLRHGPQDDGSIESLMVASCIKATLM